MARHFKDLFTQWLETQGILAEVYQPGGIFGYPPMGWQIRLRRSSVAYVVREEKPDTLLVIMFEREQSRQGLGSPFADFVRFVSLVKNSPCGITRIQGRVEASERRPQDSLEKQRIAGFYRTYLSGVDVKESPDVEWVVGELADLVLPMPSVSKIMPVTETRQIE